MMKLGLIYVHVMYGVDYVLGTWRHISGLLKIVRKKEMFKYKICKRLNFHFCEK